MLTISRTVMGDNRYQRAYAFAHRTYADDLNADVPYYPDCFFMAEWEGTVVGCLGLNDRLVSALFRSDLRYQHVARTWSQCTRVVDQAFFAVKRHPVAVPALIAVAAAHSEAVGIHKIAYAGISVSCRTIDRLGLDVLTLGPTNLTLVAPDLQQVMATWHQRHNPVSCVLDTTGAREVALGVLDRHKRSVQLDRTLDSVIFPRSTVASA